MGVAQRPDFGQALIVQILDDRRHQKNLQQDAHLVEFARLVQVDGRDEEPLVGLGAHQPFIFQTHQGHDDRGLTHFQAPSQVLVGKFLAAHQLVGEKHVLDLAVGFVRKGAGGFQGHIPLMAS